MLSAILPHILGLAGLLCAVMAGVFLAFSDFLMRGFIQVGPVAGMASMQSLNRTVLRSVFLTVFLLLVPGLAGLAWLSLSKLDGAERVLVVLAALVYGVGALFVTLLGNVPLNRRLDRLPVDRPDGQAFWGTYSRQWTRLNHVRTAACALAALALILAALSAA